MPAHASAIQITVLLCALREEATKTRVGEFKNAARNAQGARVVLVLVLVAQRERRGERRGE